MSLLRAYGLAGLFLLVGCAGTTKDARLFRMVERTSEGELKEYPNASVVDIDINSSVDIRLNRESFPSPVPDEKLNALLAQMDALARLQSELTQAGQSALSLAQRVEQKSASSQRLTKEESQQLVNSFNPPADFRNHVQAYSQHSLTLGGPGLAKPAVQDVASQQQYLASEYFRLLS